MSPAGGIFGRARACYVAAGMLPDDPQRRSLVVALMLHIGVAGGAVAAIGALIPQMIRELGWAYTDAGIVLAAGSASFVLSTSVTGFVMPRMGMRLTAAVGVGLEVLGLLLFGAWPSVATAVLIYAVLGVGFGAMEVAGNDLAISMERGGRGQLMNLMHAGFAVGGIVVPWVSSWFLASGGDWRLVYRVIGAAMLLAGLFLLTRPALAVTGSVRRARGAEAERHGAAGRGVTLLMVLLPAMGVYVGVELGVAAWLSEFTVAAVGGSVAQGARMVSLYWLGLCGGRLGAAILYRGTRHPPVIMAFALVAVVGLCIIVPAGAIGWTAVGAIVAGIGLSALYPLFVSVAGIEYPTRRSQAMGLTSASGGVGAMLVPLMIAVVAEASGIRRGIAVFLALAILLSALSAVLVVMTRRRSFINMYPKE